MAGKKKRGRFASKKIAAVMSLTLSVAPLVAPMAKASAIALPSIQGLPNDTYVYDLKTVFGAESGDYHIGMPPNQIADVRISGSLLQVHLLAPGALTVGVVANTLTGPTSQTLQIDVLQPDSDNGFHISNVARYLKNNPAATSEQVSSLLNRITPKNVPINHSPAVLKNVYEDIFVSGKQYSISDFFSEPDAGDSFTYQILPATDGAPVPIVSGPAFSFSGSMSIPEADYTLKATDRQGAVSWAALTLKAPTATNNPPVSVVGVTYDVYFPLNSYANVSLNWSELFMDHEHDSMTYTVVGATYSNGVTAAVYDSGITFSGILSSGTQFTVQAADSRGGISAPLSIRLGGVITNY